MEWAEAYKVLSPLFQPHMLGNDINDVTGRADFLDFLSGNSHSRRRNLANKQGTSKVSDIWHNDLQADSPQKESPSALEEQKGL
jgi:hypothetical protein